MSKYKVLRPISIGERREVGEVVDLNKETAERYSDALENVAEEEVAETETETNEEETNGEVGEVVEKPKGKKKGKK